MALQSFYDRVKNRLSREISSRFCRRPVGLKPGKAVISFTFDDFPISAFRTGGRILEEHGFAGTYYTALGLAGKDGPSGRLFGEADLPAVLSAGHELGCHTFDHYNAWATPGTEYERSLIRNRERLREILPGVTFASHAYPISCPNPGAKAAIARHFACARGGGQHENGTTADANALPAFFIEKSRDDFPAMVAAVDRARAAEAWLIFATHDVAPAPSVFGCSIEVFERLVRYVHETAVQVLPVSQAFAELRVV